MNNTSATISQGVSIPISVISASGTQTQFVQADLSLSVKPYVSTRDCAIAMDLTVTNEPDFVNTGARGDPTILRKEARTSMLVADGETSVIGGIYTRNSGLAYKKVPFLADIPVLGWFFKNRRGTTIAPRSSCSSPRRSRIARSCPASDGHARHTLRMPLFS